ncbi:MAG: hypothetical protein GY804_04025 [Alphaproteobacteria bacterium]|nr:hypothetical protein [Alphaproteobacteria bacterium]
MNIKTWQCPYCKYIVSDIQYMSIKINPKCRCFEKSGYSWSHYHIHEKEETNGSN